MIVKKLSLAFAGLLIAGISGLWAGDSASFVDLGFSPDGGIYMFAQYGVQSGILKPWADLFVVDVARNDFVSGGRISYTHDKPIDAGQDGTAALYRLLTEQAGLRTGFNRFLYRHDSYPPKGCPYLPRSLSGLEIFLFSFLQCGDDFA